MAIRRPGLNRVAGLAGAVAASQATVASRSGATKASPQKKAGRSSPGALDRLRRLLDDLEDRRAEAEERLARRARRRRLLADPAQVEAGRLEGGDGAVEVGGDRDDVVERR